MMGKCCNEDKIVGYSIIIVTGGSQQLLAIFEEMIDGSPLMHRKVFIMVKDSISVCSTSC